MENLDDIRCDSNPFIENGEKGLNKDIFEVFYSPYPYKIRRNRRKN